MRPHHLVFGTAALMLTSSSLLSVAERFTLASSVFTGMLVVCGVGWGMLLTERRDVQRRNEAGSDASSRPVVHDS